MQQCWPLIGVTLYLLDFVSPRSHRSHCLMWAQALDAVLGVKETDQYRKIGFKSLCLFEHFPPHHSGPPSLSNEWQLGQVTISWLNSVQILWVNISSLRHVGWTERLLRHDLFYGMSNFRYLFTCSLDLTYMVLELATPWFLSPLVVFNSLIFPIFGRASV